MATDRIRDAVHGFIHITDAERQIINWPEFQRLRSIRQLALTCYVYPGAMHTRFEHSLGVMELATRIFDKLCAKDYDLVKSNFAAINLTMDQAKQILRLACLLHDIGHLPFSHGGEAILPEGKKHEDVSIAIISSLEAQIDALYFSDATSLAIRLISAKQLIPELNFLKKILSGSIDADRMDYLLRDSLHCGVNYGNFDYQRLIETLRVIPGNDDGLDLAIEHGGIHSLEALILARYYMFTQVYNHRTRRIYDIYLKEFMSHWTPDLTNLTSVKHYDDTDLIQAMKIWPEGQDGFSCAQRIIHRKHHSVVYESSEFPDPRDRRRIIGIYDDLSNCYRDVDFIIDKNADGWIHKFFVPDTEEIGEEFVVLHNARERLLTEESYIIRKIPKRFHIIRIYVDTDNVSPERLDAIRKQIQTMERSR